LNFEFTTDIFIGAVGTPVGTAYPDIPLDDGPFLLTAQT
jgi:hypothetical protein